MKSKIPASLDGLLERIQLTFNDLERQEKRALHMLRKREEEIINAKQNEGSDENRTLKEIEILDSLTNKTLCNPNFLLNCRVYMKPISLKLTLAIC